MAVLYIQTAFLGDLCLASPTLKRIKILRPQQPIYLVCRKGFGEFFEKLGLVDKAFEVEKGNAESYQKILSELKQIEFEWIICPHESLTSAKFQKSLVSKRKIGFKKWWNFLFFNARVAKNNSLPEALRQLSLLGPIDPDTKNRIGHYRDLPHEAVPEWVDPTVKIADGTKVLRKYNILEKRAVIFPGSIWKTKKWTQEGFVELALALEKQGMQVVLMGSFDEKELCQVIQAKLGSAINLAGRTSLYESVQILNGASLVVSNDSGGQHLASLVAAPTVAIFGPTVTSQGFRPWNTRSAVAELEGLSCRPCGKHGHQVCPIGTHICMKGLSAAQVMKKVETVLGPAR